MINQAKTALLIFALFIQVAAAKTVGSSGFNAEILKSRFSSWGINSDEKASINLQRGWEQFTPRRIVVVAVVDTGIQYNHPFLKDNIHVKKGLTNQRNFGVDFSMGSASKTPIDSHGHGTHVSGIIKSIYPNVRILPLKYYNPQASGQANLKATIAALQYAVDQNVDIINYSGGGPEPSAVELQVLKEAERKGILVVAAAGNEKSNIDIKKNAYYPASYGLSNIITVGAHDQNNNIIASSNWGARTVDLAAPGLRIRSAIPGSGAGYMTGTSQATAFVTGVAALIKSQYGKLNFQQIKNVLVSSATKVGKFKGKLLSEGRLNAYTALIKAKNVYKKLYPARRGVARKKEAKNRIHIIR